MSWNRYKKATSERSLDLVHQVCEQERGVSLPPTGRSLPRLWQFPDKASKGLGIYKLLVDGDLGSDFKVLAATIKLDHGMQFTQVADGCGTADPEEALYELEQAISIHDHNLCVSALERYQKGDEVIAPWLQAPITPAVAVRSAVRGDVIIG